MHKIISVKNHTTQQGFTIDANNERVALIFSMYHDGMLKFKPYWDKGQKVEMLNCQTIRKVNMRKLKEKIMNL